MSDLIPLTQVWCTVRCPECYAVKGLACEDPDGYRQPGAVHLERMRLFLASQPVADESLTRKQIADAFGVPEHLLPEGPTDNATTTAEAELQWLNETSREKLGVCLHGVPNYTVCTECDQ